MNEIHKVESFSLAQDGDDNYDPKQFDVRTPRFRSDPLKIVTLSCLLLRHVLLMTGASLHSGVRRGQPFEGGEQRG